MTTVLRSLCAILALAVAAVPALARDDVLLKACFPPETLSPLPGENVPVKGDHRFDMPRKLADAPASEAVPAELRGSIRRVNVPKGEKVLALTFDLCEDRGEVAGYEGRIIDYLRSEGVKATLFAGGKWMRSHQARAQQLMSDPLFEIGNHSDTHHNERKLEGEALREEIVNPQRTYHAIRENLASTQCAARTPDGVSSVPQTMRLFRFPFGACNPQAMAAVNDAGMLAIQWDLSTGDPDPHVSADAIVNAMVHQAKPGSIIIGHANGRGWHTAEALPIAIPKLKALGYTFVTVSELLARGKPVIAGSCYDNRPGDTDRYDFLGTVKRDPNNPAHHASAESLPWLQHQFEQSTGP